MQRSGISPKKRAAYGTKIAVRTGPRNAACGQWYQISFGIRYVRDSVVTSNKTLSPHSPVQSLDLSPSLHTLTVCERHPLPCSDMRFNSLENLFKGHRADPYALNHSSRSLLSSKPCYTDYERIDSIDERASYDSRKTCQQDDTTFKTLTAHLPHTLITSDLGTRGRNFHLRFSHFLPEDRSLAVFAETQDTPVPVGWRQQRVRPAWKLNVRFLWTRKGLQLRSPCTVKVVVGSRWQYKVPMKTMHYWSAANGMLLVDWEDLYADYFAQEEKEKNGKQTREKGDWFRKREATIR
jgi:hypothetical protein